MKRQAHIGILVLAMGLFMAPLYGFAEEETTLSAPMTAAPPAVSDLQYGIAEEETTLSGEASITASALNNIDDSSKFKEYRDFNPVAGDATIDFGKGSYYLEFRAKDIAEDDQNYKFRMGRYGKYKIELIHDAIPHRFANDAKLIYSGKGTGTLTADDTMQSTLAGLTTITTPTQLVELTSYVNSASATDLELTRRNTKVNVDVTAFYPFKLRVEVGKEIREGERPFGTTFGGFSNIVEIPEPIDYETDQLKVSAEYIKNSFYLNANYYLSTFHNNIDTLTVDNPLRAEGNDSGAGGGGSRARFDLYPDNRYQNASLTGSVSLPLKSRLAATASWGKMEQDDNLVPYTVNTNTFTYDDPATADGNTTAEYCEDTNVVCGSDPSSVDSLPASKVNAEVKTILYNAMLTSNPMNVMHVKARYRYYEYDNNTEQIIFPGYVQYDGAWRATLGQATAIENLPTGYKKTTAGIDLGFDVATATTLTLGYTNDRTERTHREVKEQKDNIYKASLDTMPFEWLDLRTSYEKSRRDGDYDYMVPFEEEFSTISTSGLIYTPQLPWLKKYDEADRDRERVQLIATVYPTDSISLTGTYIQGKDDFRDSPFGLTEDNHRIYSIDGDYTVNERLNFYAFYSHEKYDSGQRSRQWRNTTSCIQDGDTTTGECTDPYYAVTTYDSPSNWEAENEDKVDTYGGGLKVGVVPEKLDLDLTYSYSKSDGKVKLSSAVGADNDVDPNNWTPVEFSEVDNTKTQTLNAKAKYRFTKNLSFVVGYMWEKFDIDDFNLNGFSNVPTTTTGTTQNIVLMGTLPKNYEVNIAYTKLAYNF